MPRKSDLKRWTECADCGALVEIDPDDVAVWVDGKPYCPECAPA